MPAVVPLGSTTTFTCVVIGNVFWTVNNGQIQTQSQVDDLAKANISVSLSTPNRSEVIVYASIANNATTYRCLVEEAPGAIKVLNRSESVKLIVYGECLHYYATVQVAKYSEML